MLKPLRALYITALHCVSEAAMEQGTFCVLKATQPSGGAVGNALNEAAAVAIQPPSAGPASASKLAGLLMDSVVAVDQTKYWRSFQRTEQVVGENVCLLKDGFVHTNWLTGTPAAGDTAYVGGYGKLQNTQVNAVPAVGVFETSKDADGYARVSVKIA